ncbi:DUF3862 domain-containing protein [Paenibacillus doosanensis]|uniref:DUF3862 domain-containing protein n=1 Tax=Paenibacillus doosanensis TaxID=1229154 RepID=UPI00217F3232|nr:DUF3862 domain-containing protein [Paenibacillus doosanensis]MCS7463100.1 DUF3862 domain-containing protein [Paenibacillus doosanensis]
MKFQFAIMACAIAVSLTGCGDKPAATSEPAAVTKSGEAVTITKDKFEAVENGMTYEKVVQVVGGPGELMSEAGKKGDAMHTVVYSYKGEGSAGANAIFTFQGGKLAAKAQAGLQ